MQIGSRTPRVLGHASHVRFVYAQLDVEHSLGRPKCYVGCMCFGLVVGPRVSDLFLLSRVLDCIRCAFGHKLHARRRNGDGWIFKFCIFMVVGSLLLEWLIVARPTFSFGIALGTLACSLFVLSQIAIFAATTNKH